MQKKLVALALASLASGTASAQSNVTLYGVVDAGYVYSTGNAGRLGGPTFSTPGPNVGGSNTFSGIQSGLLGGSRLGFRGEEALGNGLKAIFTLEYALDVDGNFGVGASSNGLAARQQFVGLSSISGGTVALGRQYAPGYVASGNNDAFGGPTFSPQSFLSAQAGDSITPNNNARWNNAITYTSPNWSGLTGKAIYSFGERAVNDSYNNKLTSTSDNGRYGFGLNFATGPVNLDLVYQVRQNVQAATLSASGNNSILPAAVYAASNFPTNEKVALNGILPARANPNGKDVNEWYLGGSYDLTAVKLMASYQGQNDKNAANLNNQIWSVGAVIPVLAASNIHLTYAQLIWDQGKNSLGQSLLSGSSDAAAIGWTTKMSKRTTLYAAYLWTSNDSNSIAAGPNGGAPLTGARGEQNQTLLAGINHTF